MGYRIVRAKGEGTEYPDLRGKVIKQVTFVNDENCTAFNLEFGVTMINNGAGIDSRKLAGTLFPRKYIYKERECLERKTKSVRQEL